MSTQTLSQYTSRATWRRALAPLATGVAQRSTSQLRTGMCKPLRLRGCSKRCNAADTRGAPERSSAAPARARYRERAANGELHLIEPRRFNPEHRTWLPIMHDEAEGFRVHILFSNSALAHKLKRTQDWVVIYDERDGSEGQHTVVTEQRGALRGKPVVRGREHECADYYAASTQQC